MRTEFDRSYWCVLALGLSLPTGAAFAADNVTPLGGATGGAPFQYQNNDDVIWDNGASADGGFVSQIDTLYPYDAQVADDFHLRDQHPTGASEYLVTGVNWTGVYWNQPANTNLGFNILFYDDAGGMPTGAGPTDPSGTALLNQFIPLGDTQETPTGVNANEFSYSAKLDIAFLADTDTTYWLAIQSVMNSPPHWGWTPTDGTLGNPARQGYPLVGFNYWDSVLADDVSFQLTGIEVPEPSACVMLATGWLLSMRRCRRVAARRHDGTIA